MICGRATTKDNSFSRQETFPCVDSLSRFLFLLILKVQHHISLCSALPYGRFPPSFTPSRPVLGGHLQFFLVLNNNNKIESTKYTLFILSVFLSFNKLYCIVSSPWWLFPVVIGLHRAFCLSVCQFGIYSETAARIWLKSLPLAFWWKSPRGVSPGESENVPRGTYRISLALANLLIVSFSCLSL